MSWLPWLAGALIIIVMVVITAPERRKLREALEDGNTDTDVDQ